MKTNEPEEIQYSNKWSLFFETKDKMCHSIRIDFLKPESQHVAEREAKRYLKENKPWLRKVDFICAVE